MPNELQIHTTPEIAKGVYANLMAINSTKEEFILDFFMIVAPQGNMISRVIMSPGHLKRTISALQQQLKKYEEQHGEVTSSEAPADAPKFGFQPNQ